MIRRLKLFFFGGTKVTTRIDGVHIIEDVDGVWKSLKTLPMYLLIGVVLLSIYPSWSVDDSAILFRYADNLNKYGEMNYNVGESFEGYTGFVLLPILIISPLEYVSTAHIVSMVSYLAIIILLFFMIKDGWLRMFAIITFSFSPVILTHVYSGLETLLFISLIVSVGYSYLHKRNLLIYLLPLLSLCRPEGIAFSIIILFLVKDRKTLIVWSVVMLSYLSWKYFYYGSLLPNSFYHKKIGSYFNGNFLQFKEYFLCYLLIPIGLIVLKKKFNWYFVAFFVCGLAYYLNSNLEMNYSDRFYVHLYPIILISLFYVEKIPKSVAISLIAIQLAIYAFVLPRELTTIEEEKRIIGMLKEVGTFLKTTYPKDTRLCVYAEAGWIPFVSGMNTLDLGGLMNKDITTTKGDFNALRVKYFFDKMPDVFVVTSMDDRYITGAVPMVLLNDKRFSHYKFVNAFGVNLINNKWTTDRKRHKYCEFIFQKIKL